MLDQPYMTDLIEANSMGHEPNKIHIYSASWGPTDDGKTVDGPRNATMRAIVQGVNEVCIRFTYANQIYSAVKFNVLIYVYLPAFRAAMGWAISMCGHREMVAKKTTAIVMDMRRQCGRYQLTAP